MPDAQPSGRTKSRPVTKREYETIAAFRSELRRFLRFSEEAARQSGLSPQQHQLMLAVRGMPGREYATIKEIAQHLQLRHHTVVGLVDRMEAGGLVARRPQASDHRVVEVVLTAQGARVLRDLTDVHKEELVRLAGVSSRLAEIIRGGSGGEEGP